MLIFYIPLHFFKFNTFISHKKYVISKILNSQVIDPRGCARNIKKWLFFQNVPAKPCQVCKKCRGSRKTWSSADVYVAREVKGFKVLKVSRWFSRFQGFQGFSRFSRWKKFRQDKLFYLIKSNYICK